MLKYGFWSNIPKENIIAFMGKYHRKVRRERKRKEINLKRKTKSSVSTGTHSVSTGI